MKFYTQMSSTFWDTTETVSRISAEEIGKLGLPVPTTSSTVFRKGVHCIACLEEVYISIQSDMKDSNFLKLGFLWQTLDQPSLEPGRTPQISKI